MAHTPAVDRDECSRCHLSGLDELLGREHAQDHANCDPDCCFAAKARYWRSSGGVPMQFTYGKADFHGPTIKERADDIVSGAKANGFDVSPKTTIYTGR